LCSPIEPERKGHIGDFGQNERAERDPLLAMGMAAVSVWKA
jgi:hypothetical protein